MTMFDPAEASALLTQASWLPVPGPDGATTLGELSGEGLERLRSSRQRGDSFRLARKVANVTALLMEMREDLRGFPNLAPPAQGVVQQPRLRAGVREMTEEPPARDTCGGSLALVPYVASVPPATGQKMEPRLAQSIYEQYPFLKHYRKFFGLLWAAIVYLPLVLAYLGLFYGGCFFVYIVANPAVIVKCLFKAADAVPNYASYAASQIFEQFQEEVKKRIR